MTTKYQGVVFTAVRYAHGLDIWRGGDRLQSVSGLLADQAGWMLADIGARRPRHIDRICAWALDGNAGYLAFSASAASPLAEAGFDESLVGLSAADRV